MALFFLLTTDFWPKILVITDFCDVESNDLAKIIQNILIEFCENSFIDY